MGPNSRSHAWLIWLSTITAWVEKSMLFGAFQVREPDGYFLWLDLGLLIWKRIGTCIVGRFPPPSCY